jgi:hypothetical protein
VLAVIQTTHYDDNSTEQPAVSHDNSTEQSAMPHDSPTEQLFAPSSNSSELQPSVQHVDQAERNHSNSDTGISDITVNSSDIVHVKLNDSAIIQHNMSVDSISGNSAESLPVDFHLQSCAQSNYDFPNQSLATNIASFPSLNLTDIHPPGPPPNDHDDTPPESVTQEEQHVLDYLENSEMDHSLILSLSGEECTSGQMDHQSMPQNIVNRLKAWHGWRSMSLSDLRRLLEVNGHNLQASIVDDRIKKLYRGSPPEQHSIDAYSAMPDPTLGRTQLAWKKLALL